MLSQDNRETQFFDHPPSLDDLLKQQAQAEENDPRSVFYKRVLVRPKVPVVKILIWVAVWVFLSVGCGILVYKWIDSTLWCVLATCMTALLICVLCFKNILLTAIKLYQALAPACVRKRCRYEPSCSQYMILAVEKYGAVKGLIKGLKRWAGCKPPNGGFDLP